MNLIHQLATELMSHGHSIPVDVASQMIDQGYDVSHITVDGFDVIDPTEIEYFEYIDQNH